MLKPKDATETLQADLAVTVDQLRGSTAELAEWNDAMRARYGRPAMRLPAPPQPGTPPSSRRPEST